MTKSPLWCLVAAAVLNACSSGGLPRGESAPPPDLSGFESTAPSAQETVKGAKQPAPDAGGEKSIEWIKPGATEAQQFADAEACYGYAWAQVDNDIRIDDDIASARTQVGSGFTRLNVVNRQADYYYYRKERIVRLEDCMRSKGYRQE